MYVQKSSKLDLHMFFTNQSEQKKVGITNFATRENDDNRVYIIHRLNI